MEILFYGRPYSIPKTEKDGLPSPFVLPMFRVLIQLSQSRHQSWLGAIGMDWDSAPFDAFHKDMGSAQTEQSAQHMSSLCRFLI